MTPTLPEVLLAFVLSRATGVSIELEDLVCLSRNVYHEARGESPRGRRAVAFVTLNRVGKPGFRDTICEVVYQPGPAFSWTDDGRSDVPKDMIALESSMLSALEAVRGDHPDPTEGATYFNAGPRPSFARDFIKTASIGAHTFYQEN